MNLSVSTKLSRNGKQRIGLYVWRDPPASGGWNMAADEALARRSEETNCVLMRLYGWHPHTVSLGSFQRFVDFSETSELSHWPVVRRPSGGGAIIHGTDLTYGLAVPCSHDWSRGTEKLYAAVHGALVEELSERHLGARMMEATNRESDQSFYCFNRRAFGDLVIEIRQALLAPVTIRYSGVHSEDSLGLFCSTAVYSCIRNPMSKVKGAMGLGDVLEARSAQSMMLLTVGCIVWRIG